MEVFCFRAGGTEDINAFNSRLADFASKNDITGIVSSVIGTTLVLSLAMAVDGILSHLVVRPVVIEIGAGDEAGLETTLTDIINAAKAEDNPDGEVTSVPLEIKMLPAPFIAGDEQRKVLGYAVLQIVIGEMEV